MTKRHTVRILVLLLAGIILATMVAQFVFRGGRSSASTPLPNPNGYDDFVKASELVAGNVGDFPTLDHDSLAALVSTNAEAFRLLRLGLSRQCLWPFDPALTNAAGNLNQLAGMKRLAQLLAVEGRLREMDNRPADAALSYTDAIQFGNQMSRGGFLIVRLVGIACEAIGCRSLARVTPQLGPEEARGIAARLMKIDDTRITWAEVMQSERNYAYSQLRQRLNPIVWVVALWQARQAVNRAEIKHNLEVVHVRLLAVEFALRCYWQQQGRLPARLNELATNYLAKMPLDVFTGRSLVYRAQGTNWLLYSVGPDGVDDGGKPAGRSQPIKGDLSFDSVW